MERLVTAVVPKVTFHIMYVFVKECAPNDLTLKDSSLPYNMRYKE